MFIALVFIVGVGHLILIFNYVSIFSVGADASSNEDIYYSDIVAKTFTAYSSSLYNRSSFVTDYYYTKRDIENK